MQATSHLQKWHQAKRQYLIKRGERIVRRIDRYLASQSIIPVQPVFDPSVFPQLRQLETNWRDILAEARQILRFRDQIPRFQDVSPDQYRISQGDQWKTFFLLGFGFRSDVNARLCPKTMALLDSLPGVQTALFSILAPGTHIPRHKGVSKNLVNCHLGLIVPENREACYLICGGERLLWQEGKVIVFDDTYPHEVHNLTDEERVVLMLQLERPLRPRGKLLAQAMMWLLKRSAYVADARDNQRRWEAQLAAHLKSEGLRLE